LKEVLLDYGKDGLPLHLDEAWEAHIIEPCDRPPVGDATRAILENLRSPIASAPLRERVDKNQRVGIVFSDLTRPAPNGLILPAILSELGHLPLENITLFNALGTHRPNTDGELRLMLGDELVERYTIVQNGAFDQDTQVCLGKTSSGNPVWINRRLLECDLKILTGFIEPHIFAGFSGGGKAIMPGMAGQTTIFNNHAPRNVLHPKATWGVTHGNPIFEEIKEIAQMIGDVFLLNVTLSKDKRITGVFAGDLLEAHRAGRKFAAEAAFVKLPRAYDIVVVTNSGYPLDLNLYQSVKGMSVAARAVKPGGAIIIATDCWDGIPEDGMYHQLLSTAASPAELLERIQEPGFLGRDTWQAALQAQIQLKADVYVYSHNLSGEQIRSALLQPCSNIEDTLRFLMDKYGPSPNLCILPRGPLTVPVVE
jgi:nickel-dependent lactate racemase